jgi:hypothetical protein
MTKKELDDLEDDVYGRTEPMTDTKGADEILIKEMEDANCDDFFSLEAPLGKAVLKAMTEYANQHIEEERLKAVCRYCGCPQR